MEERRAPQSFVAQTVRVARTSATTVWDWTEKRKIAAHIVFGVTVWLSIRIAEWALTLPLDLEHTKYTGVDVGAMQAAVLAPWGLMQGAMFKFYMELIKSNGGSNAPG